MILETPGSESGFIRELRSQKMKWLRASSVTIVLLYDVSVPQKGMECSSSGRAARSVTL